MVCMSVGRLVGLSVTVVSPAKMAEPIKMPFGLKTRVGQGTTYYMRFRSLMGRGNFEGVGWPIVKNRHLVQ